MTVSLRQQELRVSVSVANAELFKSTTSVRGFLLPQSGPNALPLLDNLWPADSPVVEAQETALKKLATLLKDPSFRIGTGFPLPLEGFLDQHANVISSDRFRGKQVVINFIYGRCADPAMCPATAIRMTRLRDRLPTACRDKVEIVFITLDPQFDTPARCLEYLKARNANVPGVSMLTGSYEAVQALSKLCGIWFKTVAEGIFEHAQTMLWVDANGTLREAFPASDPGVTSLENALLLETAEPGVPSITQ